MATRADGGKARGGECRRRAIHSRTMGPTTRHQSGATQAHCLCAGKRSFTWRAGLTLFDDRAGSSSLQTPSSSSRLRHYSPPDDEPRLYIWQGWRDTPSFSPVRTTQLKWVKLQANGVLTAGASPRPILSQGDVKWSACWSGKSNFPLRAKKGQEVCHLLDEELSGSNLKARKDSVRPIIIFSCPQTDESWRFLVLVVLRQACLFTLLPCSLHAAFKQAASDNAEQRQQPIMTFIFFSFFFSKLGFDMFH